MEIFQSIRKEAFEAIDEARDFRVLEDIKVAFLGKKGRLTAILKSLKDLTIADRKTVGNTANALKREIEEKLNAKKKEFQTAGLASPVTKDWLDISAPGKKISKGHLHPLTRIIKEMTSIFESMGFEIIDGPEIETEYYNFDALNIPKNHPARDLWDTFWVKNAEAKMLKSNFLLRTHTSPNQIRYMEAHQPPFRIVVPGRCFRYEATDATHEIQFYQLEGLMIGEGINLSHLKGVLEMFLRRLFKDKNLEIRFRPSYFPFVEPGVEVDIKLGRGNNSSRSFGKAGWLEIAGAGMVHPQVLKNVKLNPQIWQGFAFGMGIDRIAMLKYKIDDIRLFYAGDLRFIKQF